MITYGGEPAMLDEHLLSRFPLHVCMLNAEQTRRSQQACCLVNHHPDHLQPVLAGEQGKERIVITYLGRHGLERLQRDIGRVGDHQIDCALELRQDTDHVLHVQLNRGIRQIPRRVRRSLFRHLDSLNPGASEFCSYGFGDCTASSPKLDYYRQVPRLTARDCIDHRTQLFDRPAGHHFGLGPGHEDARTHFQFQVAKVSPTGQVL